MRVGLPTRGTVRLQAQLFSLVPRRSRHVRQVAYLPSPAVQSPQVRQLSLDRSLRSVTTFAASSSTPLLSTATPTSQQHRNMSAGQHASIREELVTLFNTAIQTAFPDAGVEAAVAQCNQPKFGDYQCNNAMALFGRMKGKEGAPKNPRAVAEAIVAAVPENDIIQEMSLAGPGFINIKLNVPWLTARMMNMLKNGIGSWAPAVKKRVVVDFSSPNVAKEMHVGHLRSTIIGDTLCKLLEFCGADVVRLNHIGDWGTQFGMLIQHMKENDSTSTEVSDLMELYRAAKGRFDAEDDFKTRSREAVTALQSGDPESIAKWEIICDASRKEFQALYDRLGVKITERGESFYNPMLQDAVKDLQACGVVEESDGAQVSWVDGKKVPLIVQKSDGGFGYASTDLAAVRHRVETEKAEWVIYVTDVGQAEHFEMVFATARKAGWLPTDPKATPKVSHVGFGLVLGDDGKRFRTRSGDLVRLVELLDEAKARCAVAIREREAEKPEEERFSEEEIDAAASAMGYGACKYFDLKNQRLTNYKFSYDQMLSLQGNTAVYLLYALARIYSIQRKCGKDIKELIANSELKLEHEKEKALALKVARFPEALEEALAELMPNRITEYQYELSQLWSEFYTECKISGSEEEASRLLLAEATARTFQQCFELLGIQKLDRI